MAVITILAFSIIGVMVTAIVIHEWMHWLDYHDTSIQDRICIVDINGDWSGWSFFTTPFAEYMTFQETEKHVKYSEVKAYIVSSLIILFFIVCEVVVLRNYWRRD